MEKGWPLGSNGGNDERTIPSKLGAAFAARFVPMFWQLSWFVVIGSRRKEDNTTSINIGINNKVAQFVWEGKDKISSIKRNTNEDNVECSCFNIVIGCVSILLVYISRNRNGDIEKLVYI
jgi:hypothetical protein